MTDTYYSYLPIEAECQNLECFAGIIESGYKHRSLPAQFHLFILSRSYLQYIGDCVGVEA